MAYARSNEIVRIRPFEKSDAENFVSAARESAEPVGKWIGGYWVRQRYQGRGIATAAVQLLIQFAFKELKLTRMELVIRPENVASCRVAEKIGATFE